MTSPLTPPGVALSAADLALRPAKLDDAAFAADVETALAPDEPADPELTRHWWRSAEVPGWTNDRLVVELDGRPVGYGLRRHPDWEQMPERFDRIHARLLPAVRSAARLGAVYALLEERSRADGTRVLSTSAREGDPMAIELLLARGYREDHRSKDWELDLVRHRDRVLAIAQKARATMREQGVSLLTLDRDPDPEKYRKLWRMAEEARLDTPRTVPIVPDPFEVFMRWFESPGVREDRFWIAKLGDEVVGCSVLAYPPVRGNVWTDWTATARAVRGRGVARALKLETVAQAMALGVTRVRTSNDGRNAPILHLNEQIGYEPIPGWIGFLKDA